jgi:carbon-monoxide dehydrogenase medium subunit
VAPRLPQVAERGVVKPAPFLYAAPSTLADAIELLGTFGDEAKLLAGGQSLGPLLNLRLATPNVLIDLGRVGELSAPLQPDPGGVTVPAMTTQRAAEECEQLATVAPLLVQALPFIAHRTIRNRGTVGGSAAHSDPSAEIPAVTVAAGASMTIRGAAGTRVVPADQFYTGYFSTVVEPDEVLVSIHFPAPAAGEGSAWAEFAPRAGDFAIVGVAAVLTLSADRRIGRCRLAYSGLADKPWEPIDVLADVAGEPASTEAFRHLADEAARRCDPIDDAVGSARYRRHLVRHLTIGALDRAATHAQRGT